MEMKKHTLMIMAACAAAMLAGCTVTKVEYERNGKGETTYRIYRNDHWLKTEATGVSGGMTEDGKFEFSADGVRRSPSEEFNRTMQTYTTAFIQLAQIAAAAYNPSASAAIQAQPARGAAAATAPNPSQPSLPSKQSKQSLPSQPAGTADGCTGDSCEDADGCTGDSCEDLATPVNICTGEPLAGGGVAK